MISLLIVTLLLIFSSISNAIMDTLQHHFNISIFRKLNSNWWDPSISWKHKYKGGDPKNGPRFFGATTYFVLFTDAWHFFQFIFFTSIHLILLLLLNIIFSFIWWYWILGLVILKVLHGLIFELLYKKLFIL